MRARDVVGTGYEELDRLIGRHPGLEGGDPGKRGRRTPLRYCVPLGFPAGRLSCVEGSERPLGWAERIGAPVWGSGDWGALQQLLQLSLPLIWCSGLPAGLDPMLERLTAGLKRSRTALVFDVEVLEPSLLRYHADLWLRFEGSRVRVVRNTLAPSRGFSIPWPPG